MHSLLQQKKLTDKIDNMNVVHSGVLSLKKKFQLHSCFYTLILYKYNMYNLYPTIRTFLTDFFFFKSTILS